MTMKNALLFFAFSLFLLGSCSSPQRLLDSGDYDAAIDLCIRRLSGKEKKKSEYVRTLEDAFEKATSRDMRLAESLEREGRPENWERINEIHRAIQRRQGRVEPLLPLIDENGYKASFQFVRIDELEQKSKENAATYFYNRATELIGRAEKGDKLAARQAYAELGQIDRYYRDFRDKELLKQRALDLGTDHILVSVVNDAPVALPQRFEEELLQLSVGDLNSQWRLFYTNNKARNYFDYLAKVRFTDIAVSPERVQERSYVEHKEIEEGWEYVLDANGNVLKDSLGNDVRVPKKIFITAEVLEVYQSKVASLSGRVEWMEIRTNNLLRSEPVAVDAVFENYASTFRGDRRALSAESLSRIGNTPQPFPTNESLLLLAARMIRPSVKQKLAYAPL